MRWYNNVWKSATASTNKEKRKKLKRGVVKALFLSVKDSVSSVPLLTCNRSSLPFSRKNTALSIVICYILPKQQEWWSFITKTCIYFVLFTSSLCLSSLFLKWIAHLHQRAKKKCVKGEKKIRLGNDLVLKFFWGGNIMTLNMSIIHIWHKFVNNAKM